MDPENVQGLHNLCVVFVERGSLRKAEACLKRAHKLAPNEEYIIRHLKIVQQRIAKANLPLKQIQETDNFEFIEENDENNHETSKYFKDNQQVSDSEKYKNGIDENNNNNYKQSTNPKRIEENIQSDRQKSSAETFNNDRDVNDVSDEYKKKTPVKPINSEPVFTGDFVAESSTTYSQQKQRTVVPSQYTNPMPHIPKPNKRRQNILSSHDLDEVSLS